MLNDFISLFNLIWNTRETYMIAIVHKKNNIRNSFIEVAIQNKKSIRFN